MRGSASEDDFSSGNPFLFCSQNWVRGFIAGTRGAGSGGRLENEPRGFQMAASGAKMALGFRAQNPETKADRCLPKLRGLAYLGVSNDKVGYRALACRRSGDASQRCGGTHSRQAQLCQLSRSEASLN